MRPVTGTTLVELLVALVILGLMAGVTGLAVHSLRPPAAADTAAEVIQRARADAIRSGTPIRLVLDTAGSAGPVAVMVTPDGGVTGIRR